MTGAATQPRLGKKKLELIGLLTLTKVLICDLKNNNNNQRKWVLANLLHLKGNHLWAF